MLIFRAKIVLQNASAILARKTSLLTLFALACAARKTSVSALAFCLFRSVFGRFSVGFRRSVSRSVGRSVGHSVSRQLEQTNNARSAPRRACAARRNGARGGRPCRDSRHATSGLGARAAPEASPLVRAGGTDATKRRDETARARLQKHKKEPLLGRQLHRRYNDYYVK